MNQEDFSDTAWQIEFVKGLITQDPLLFAPFSENLQPKRRRTVRRTVLNFWNTNWGLMIKELQTLEEGSYKRRIFRRRFRVPFDCFALLAQLCKEKSVLFNHSLRKILPI
jgi:hypothetical protein